MKFLNSLIILLFLTNIIIAQKITRGPELGEIYFKAPTYTAYGLYYSTDFGETAICVDSISSISTIAADNTPNGIYCYISPNMLYYSDNCGNSNSWELKYSGSYLNQAITSGIIPGHIFSSFYMHSENYGEDFISHSINGYFGERKNVSIDNIDEHIGYVISYKITVGDTLYLFRSFDMFENLELINKFTYSWNEHLTLARGNDSGEVFMFNFTKNSLWFSNDYFDSVIRIDTFNILNFSIVGIDGDNRSGEFYLLYGYIDPIEDIRHAYIFHSSDYGVTFDVYHPFAKGNQPLMVNFSSVNKEPQLSNAIEFDNFSIGNVTEYQWDFENDGTIDSYDEYPIHIYEDTGHYSVKLTIVGADSSNTFIKENYIHVIDTITPIITNVYRQNQIKIYPNPFLTHLTILLDNITENYISIYDIYGYLVKRAITNNEIFIWDGSNETGQKCQPGIYYLKIDKSVHKVLLTN